MHGRCTISGFYRTRRLFFSFLFFSFLSGDFQKLRICLCVEELVYGIWLKLGQLILKKVICIMIFGKLKIIDVIEDIFEIEMDDIIVSLVLVPM